MTTLSLKTALACTLLCAVVLPVAHAADSTLKKVGNAVAYPVKKAAGNASKTANKGGQAVQYPVRKAGENASVAAHQATGKNSVIRRRHKKVNRVVTPKGDVYTMPQAKKKGLTQ